MVEVEEGSLQLHVTVEPLETLSGVPEQSLLLVVYSCSGLHTSYWRDWSSDVCSSDLEPTTASWAVVTIAVGCLVTVEISASGEQPLVPRSSEPKLSPSPE